MKKAEVLIYGKDSLDRVFSRSQLDDTKAYEIVRDIINNVRENGDNALFDYTLKLDKLHINKDTIKVNEAEIEQAYKEVDNELLEALRRAKSNVLEYHKKQVIDTEIEGQVGWIMKPMKKAGIYVPGGTASYPSSVLMCVLPAIAAGVEDIIVVTPRPENPLTLVALSECGVKNIYKIGGAQAIAALAYGTETIPKVDIIAGPGNIYVALAKKLVFGNVAIDMIAGPSEILVIADETAKPDYVINDLLSQAEHDAMSASILITNCKDLANIVAEKIYGYADKFDRADIIKKSLDNNLAIILVDSLETAVKISNKVAPEHLELAVNKPGNIIDLVDNAGAIFCGHYSPEPLGDYYAGPSHTLPTSGTARYFSVLNTLTYMKRISYICYDKDSLAKVSDDIIRIAESEGLDAHAEAIRIRRK